MMSADGDGELCAGTIHTHTHNTRKLLLLDWQLFLLSIMSAIKKILRLPHKFIVKPAPGWSQLTCSEVAEILNNPWGKYKFTPHVALSPTREISLTNVDFRQGMEVTCRLLCAHDVEWIIAKSRCKSRGELHRFLAELPFQALVGESNKANIFVHGHSNRSFVDSSSMLKEEFASRMLKRTGEIVNTISTSQQQTNTSHPRTKFKLTLLDNIITLSVSMAGADAPLFKRGYKYLTTDADTASVAVAGGSGRNHAVAPLPEHHAAACFRATVQAIVQAEAKEETRGPHVNISGDGDGASTSEDSGEEEDEDRAVEVEEDPDLVKGMHFLMGQRLKRVYVPYAGTGECEGDSVLFYCCLCYCS